MRGAGAQAAEGAGDQPGRLAERSGGGGQEQSGVLMGGFPMGKGVTNQVIVIRLREAYLYIYILEWARPCTCADQAESTCLALTLVGSMQLLLTAIASVFVYRIRFFIRLRFRYAVPDHLLRKR